MEPLKIRILALGGSRQGARIAKCRLHRGIYVPGPPKRTHPAICHHPCRILHLIFHYYSKDLLSPSRAVITSCLLFSILIKVPKAPYTLTKVCIEKPSASTSNTVQECHGMFVFRGLSLCPLKERCSSSTAL